MFSGGKDSTATLHATLAAAHEKPDERLPLRVIFWDEEAIPLETVEYVRRISQRDDVNLEWYCVPIACGNACSRRHPFWFPWAPEEKHKWVRPLPPEAITELPGGYEGHNNPDKRLTHHELAGKLFDPAIHGEAVQALGIRAAESLRRYQAVTRREQDNWIVEVKEPTVRGALWKAYPVYDWGNDDVWTAPDTFDWDYNRAYDAQEMYGLPPSRQRMGPPFGHEPLENLAMWRECYPDIWHKLCERAPGANTAARYSTTDLYAYKSNPVKPDGITWMEFIISMLNKHEPAVRADLGRRIQYDINYHREHTDGAPMAETARHPITGASWGFIAMLASRGDRMNRKQMTSNRIPPGDPKHEAAMTKYRNEIEQIKAEGRFQEII